MYSLNSLGGRATLRHQANLQNYWTVSLINEFQRSSITNAGLEDFTIRNNLIALGLDPRTGETRGTTAAVALDVNRNTTNNMLDANRGYVLIGHVEQAGKWLWGTYNYWEVQWRGAALHARRALVRLGEPRAAGHHRCARRRLAPPCRSSSGISSAARRASGAGGDSRSAR